jgi:DNA-binding NtrC family response regulator
VVAAPPIDARVSWSGRPPPASLVERLAAAGVTVQREPGGEGVVPILATPSAAVPRPSTDAPWIWLPARVPDAAAVAAAAAAGAYDVFPASLEPAALAARLLARLGELQVPPLPPPGEAPFVADSPGGRRLLAELAHAARTSMPVLLTGETGTGKEVAARLLHAWSSRRQKRFVPINCAAIPNELLESELFGYARGAFSGAVQSYDGELAAAEGGSVFLDEVDDTPTSFQVKLLRVLEDRMVSRLGDNLWRKVDFRILAATNRDLRPLIARGLFGADLYERLAIVSIRLPPLRERQGDLSALVRHMIARFYDEEPAARERHQVADATPEALALLAAYRWPGNIRELRNVIFGALVRKRAGAELLVSDLPRRLIRGEEPGLSGEPAEQAPVDLLAVQAAVAAGGFNLRAAIETLERAALLAALARTSGNAAGAAALLGEVGRGTAQDPGATVRAMMRRLGVERRPRRAR